MLSFETLLYRGDTMVHKLVTPLSLLLLTASIPLKADFCDGLLGGFAGFTAGLITSAALSNNCTHSRVVVYEKPVLVERPYVVVENPCVTQRRAELAWREENVRRAEYHQQKKQAAMRQEEAAMRQAERRAQEARKSKVVEKTIVTTIASDDAEQKRRELALKERQIELELIKEKKELLKEENRKKELALRERELGSRRKA